MKKSPIFLVHLQNRKWRKQMTMILLPTEVGDGSFVWVCLWWTSWLLDNKIARELFMMLWWKDILHQEERQVKDILFYIFQWLRWVNCVRILRYITTFPQRFPKLITRILYPKSHCTHPEGVNPTSALLYKMAGGTQSLIISHQTVKRVTLFSFIAWVASLASSMMYLFAGVGTFLAERFGSRLVVIIGSFVSAAGLLASSFATTIAPLYATYGVVWGLGASLGFFPSLVILTKYFKRRLALVSGIALAGAASGTLVYGPIIEKLSSKFGISTTFRILAGLQSLMLLSALTFSPVSSVTRRNQQPRNREFDLSFFRSRAYIIWVVAQCIFMVVFLVPFVHLVRSF